MAWFILIVAAAFEIAWAVGLKYTEGFTRLWPTLGTVVAMVASLWLLGVAVRTLPLGTAYAIWTGIGTVALSSLFNDRVFAAAAASPARALSTWSWHPEKPPAETPCLPGQD